MSVCLAIDLRAGLWRWARNGHLQEGVVSFKTATPPTITGGGTLIIGQEQDALNGGFDKFQSLRGSLTDLKLYEGFLDTTQLVSYTLWFIVGANGMFGEWFTKSCDFKAHLVCHFDQPVTLRMRGLCRRSNLDRKYLMIDDGLFPKFVGELYSEIIKHPDTYIDPDTSSDYGIWKIVRKDIPTVKATLVLKSPIQYPVGLNTWEVEDAECGNGVLQLMMTSCKEHQFSCTNGQCINIGQRCDLEVDCSDFSDEAQCSFMDPPEGYDSSKPPARQHRHTPISIGLHINILTIRELDISNFKFVCEIVVTLEWYDDRLKYFHLNYAETINVVSNITDVWIPTLEYLGHGDTTSEVTERKVTLWIRRLSQPLPDDDEILIEGEVFTGAENLLVLKRKMTVTTLCRYNLEAFPFDTQTCALGMVLSHVSSQYVALVPQDGGVTLTGERRMLEYVLVDEQIVSQDKGNHSGQTMELTFKNLSTFYVFSTYLPTLIIVVIGYLVFYFPLDNFNERIMVGLTGLLVEATFFSQVSASIPRTAYLKLVDIWFVFCIVSLFLVVVTVTVVQWLQERGTAVMMRVGNKVSMPKVTKRRLSAFGVNRATRIIFPLLATAFLSVYISVALSDKNNHL
ncbi:gamma-aminobutyric acid receptor subunit beta-3-like [Panulirus ornatus]|uniref:gamma-aminobutyric acid receptor subunit beta-3-like n=1 Tax=Panulirus ornatus TaxID=150431 RepID=UPI003A871DB0